MNAWSAKLRTSGTTICAPRWFPITPSAATIQPTCTSRAGRASSNVHWLSSTATTGSPWSASSRIIGGGGFGGSTGAGGGSRLATGSAFFFVPDPEGGASASLPLRGPIRGEGASSRPAAAAPSGSDDPTTGAGGGIVAGARPRLPVTRGPSLDPLSAAKSIGRGAGPRSPSPPATTGSTVRWRPPGSTWSAAAASAAGSNFGAAGGSDAACGSATGG